MGLQLYMICRYIKYLQDLKSIINSVGGAVIMKVIIERMHNCTCSLLKCGPLNCGLQVDCKWKSHFKFFSPS